MQGLGAKYPPPNSFSFLSFGRHQKPKVIFIYLVLLCIHLFVHMLLLLGDHGFLCSCAFLTWSSWSLTLLGPGPLYQLEEGPPDQTAPLRLQSLSKHVSHQVSHNPEPCPGRQPLEEVAYWTKAQQKPRSGGQTLQEGNGCYVLPPGSMWWVSAKLPFCSCSLSCRYAPALVPTHPYKVSNCPLEGFAPQGELNLQKRVWKAEQEKITMLHAVPC